MPTGLTNESSFLSITRPLVKESSKFFCILVIISRPTLLITERETGKVLQAFDEERRQKVCSFSRGRVPLFLNCLFR